MLFGARALFMGADLQPPNFPELPEWAAKAAGAAGLGGLVTAVVAFTAKVIERFVPSADRRSRERVDMLEQANRRIRDLQAANHALSKRADEADAAADRYRDEYFGEREKHIKTRGELVQAMSQLELLRNKLQMGPPSTGAEA